MNGEIFKYVFVTEADMAEVEASLLLAVLATECLHGESQVRLEASHAMDTERRACVIAAGTDVGRDLNRLFVGFLRREFGEDSFRVERIRNQNHQTEEVCA